MDQDLETLRTRVNEVRAKLDAAAQGRPYTLLAASKTQSAETINLLPQCGIFDYGENRVQGTAAICSAPNATRTLSA